DFLRWSPHVRNPSYRKESRLTPGELVELQKTIASYGDRVGSPGGTGSSRRDQSEAVMRAASGAIPVVPDAPEAEQGSPPSAIRPKARRPATSPKRKASSKSSGSNGDSADAPVEHYDDLKADEIVKVIDSLEPADLDALLEYEQANRDRSRVTAAIEKARARAEAR
ncbi:MAG: hypothetical protein QOI80_588, partial [Solirubrobacteraceae bacterium]|nr:hypothetical protein [Solirubrobacteraceae bacterium]